MSKKKDNKNEQRKMFTTAQHGQVIKCKLKYRDGYVAGVAVFNQQDGVFDENLGKAIAYARAEQVVRKNEIENMEYFIESIRFGTLCCRADSRLLERTLNGLYETLNRYRKYLKHQNNMVNILTQVMVDPNQETLPWKGYLKMASDKAFDIEKEKEAKCEKN